MKSFVAVLLLASLGAGCTSRGKETGGASPGIDGIPSANGLQSSGMALVEDPGTPPGSQKEFPKTDFSRSIVEYGEILSGGPPKDGIPAIDNPSYVSVKEADEWIQDQEPVFVLSLDGETHVYPVQILMWHEIVNDTVGDRAVTVTYCPLCNSSLAFDRRFDGRVLDFGTTGRLRYSNLVMYDRQTETWWQQADGRGLIGVHAGEALSQIPLLTLPWEQVRTRYPEADVVSRLTGHSRPYGSNPYTGYDSSEFPFLYRGPAIDEDFSPMTRVVAVSRNGDTRAYPYPLLRAERVVNDGLGGDAIVVIWQPGTASALDASTVAEGRDVGSANGFLASVGGQTLSFREEAGRLIDTQTRSEWDATGYAVAGPLRGERLEPLVSVQHLWFSWTSFRIQEDSGK